MRFVQLSKPRGRNGHVNATMETKYKRQSIGKGKAIELAKSGWWKGRPAKEVAKFQLFTHELAMA